jgi:hypothetical protein
VNHQREDGRIPSFYDSVSLEPREDLNVHFPAETAGSALFLCELYSRFRNPEYLEAARRSMRFIAREVVPRRKWFDVETYLSCSREPFDFYDSYTLQAPQSTLSMIMAAFAFASLFQQDHEGDWLSAGCAILDYLSLYQQIWSPPFFSRPVFGGFGVQNTDAEWSDARGCYAADLYFRYYDLTDNRYYFERGAAALLSLPPMIPYENWGHTGLDGPGARGSIHWGEGSMVVSAVQAREKYGDAWIHASGGWGCALNACFLSDLQCSGDRIAFRLTRSLEWPGPALVKFTGLDHARYDIVVNGLDLGTRSASLLRSGIEIPLEPK